MIPHLILCREIWRLNKQMNEQTNSILPLSTPVSNFRAEIGVRPIQFYIYIAWLIYYFKLFKMEESMLLSTLPPTKKGFLEQTKSDSKKDQKYLANCD